MEVIIPFKAENPKSRLADMMSIDERINFSKEMLLDVIDAVGDAVLLVPKADDFIKSFRFIEDRRELNIAINSLLKRGDIAVIMSDIPLLSKKIFNNFLKIEGDIILSPGRRGGTNMLFSRVKNFRVSYHYGSFIKHLKIAEQMKIKASIFDSFYASIDIDEKDDLLELMIHGKGKRSYEYLEKLGFYVDYSKKNPELIRDY